MKPTDPKLAKEGATKVFPPALYLVFSQRAPRTGKIYKLHKDRIVIGSVVSADLFLSSPQVSPIHAVVEIQWDDTTQAPAVFIYDLASDQGTRVNGKTITTTRLVSGDEITVGDHVLSFAIEQPALPKRPEGASALKNDRKSERFVEDFQGRKLFIPAEEVGVLPNLVEEGTQTFEIFDHRPSQKQALEVVLSWSSTILDIEHFVDSAAVEVGPSPRNHFMIPGHLPGDSYRLASGAAGDLYQIHLDSNMRGVVQSGGELRTLAQLRSQGQPLVLGKNDFAKISVGELDFYLSYTAAPPKLKPRRFFERDAFLMQIMISALISLSVLLTWVRNADLVSSIEIEQMPERIATILYQPEKFPPKPPAPKKVSKPEVEKKEVQAPKPKPTTKVTITPSKDVPKEIPKEIQLGKDSKSQAVKSAGGPARKAETEAKEGAGARAKGLEGTRGSKTAAPGKTPQDKASRPSPDGGTGVGGANSQVSDEGNIDVLKGATSQIKDLLGGTAGSLGASGSKLEGFGNFATLGKGGAGLSGSGKGGGGDAEQLGGLADKGRGGGRVGTGMGAAGQGEGLIGGKTRVTLRTGGPEESVVTGSIDKNAIEAAILAHRDEFRLCYEREINAESPDLSGRVTSSFVIGSTGRVTESGIASSTLRSPNVERCVANVIKRIQFPTPAGGGVVQVTYPFKFSAGRK
jgi:outer membrane biosynthesis protein TonB/pSer/pThr/pTyr-binding forkhead associated (FHA) protein